MSKRHKLGESAARLFWYMVRRLFRINREEIEEAATDELLYGCSFVKMAIDGNGDVRVNRIPPEDVVITT